MEVILPAILLKKFGLPQATICRIMAKEKRGRQNFSTAFLRAKGTRASRAQTAMPVQVASAAAQTPHPSTARDANSPSAPIRRIREGAAANRMPPTPIPARTIIMQAQVKILCASFSFFFPKAMAMGTAAPTPIKSAREKLIITKGMARLTAAKAVAPKKRPTKTPSKV